MTTDLFILVQRLEIQRHRLEIFKAKVIIDIKRDPAQGISPQR